MKKIILVTFLTAMLTQAYAAPKIYVKMYSRLNGYGNPSQKFNLSKLQAVAFENNVKVINGSEEDQSPMVIPINANGIIYSSAYSYKMADNFHIICNYVKNGGRAILFYNTTWILHNELLQDIFNVSISKELICKAEGSLKYPSSSLPSFLQNYNIGVMPSVYRMPGINNYIVSLNDGENNTATSISSGKDRIISSVFDLGKGKIMFIANVMGVHPSTPSWNDEVYNSYINVFFNDENIDNYDNSNAAIELLKWLSLGVVKRQ